MLREQLPNIIIWVLLWSFSWGFFLLYLHKKIDYTNHFVWTTLYFLTMAIVSSLIFKDHLYEVLQNFILLPFIILVATMALGVFLHSYLPRHLEEPKDYFLKYPKRQYFILNQRRLFSKSAELLFQQIFVVLLILFLRDAGLNIRQIILVFAIIFGVVHIPLIFIERNWPSWYFTIFSIFSAIVFPVLILKVHYGFVYSYIVHWVFYTLTAVGFWVWYNRKKAFICSECRLSYMDENWKTKCEEWCKKYQSCNLEIIEHAIKK